MLLFLMFACELSYWDLLVALFIISFEFPLVKILPTLNIHSLFPPRNAFTVTNQSSIKVVKLSCLHFTRTFFCTFKNSFSNVLLWMFNAGNKLVISAILLHFEAGVTFDNSFFDNYFDFVCQLKNGSFLGPVFARHWSK